MKVKLFPETSPMCNFDKNHFRFLEECLLHDGRIMQKHVVTQLNLDKTTVSELKADFIQLGWCKDVNLYSCREIEIRLCRLNEIKLFLSQWKYLQQSIPVRPHDINARCLILGTPNNFSQAIYALTPKYRVVISSMRNNTEYTFETDYGKIILHSKGQLIEFWVKGFVLPVRKEDVPNLEYYIKDGIQERLLNLHSILKEHFKPFRIQIQDCISLRHVSIGIIISKKNVSTFLNISHELKDLGLFRDDSIYGCDEYEAKGQIDIVLNKVVSALNNIFTKEVN